MREPTKREPTKIELFWVSVGGGLSGLLLMGAVMVQPTFATVTGAA